MEDNELKCIIEALLMSADQPLTCRQILTAFEECQQPTMAQLQRVLFTLATDYEDRAIELKQVTDGYYLQTKAKYGVWIRQLHKEKVSNYSRATLETLAIIAYRQPVTRADIEDIRGVAVSSSILKTLLEREWIKTAGQRAVPGKPALYVTTTAFLEYFNLETLEQLPQLPLHAENTIDKHDIMNLPLLREPIK